MKHFEEILLTPDTSIMEALERLVVSQQQIILVVDEKRKLLGTVVDGDVRRGILKKIPLESPIAEIMKQTPATITSETDRKEALVIMEARGIHHIPVLDGDGRVIGLESLSELLRRPQHDNWVVLMAGGEGRRLKPLTDDTPKPLLNVGDRPLLETIVGSFINQGFRKFFFAVNHKAEMFEEHFGDGSQLEVSIEYLREDTPLGTAGALSLLPDRPSAPIIVMNGDLMTSVNIGQLLSFHEEHRAAATMCVREYEFEVPYGVAELEGAVLTGISEKPVQSFFINAGIYLLSPEALEIIPKNEHYDMTALYQDLILRGKPTIAFPLREYWLDIGRVADLEQAQLDFPKIFS
jgi:dTDP-glucose pyrophosphorylase